MTRRAIVVAILAVALGASPAAALPPPELSLTAGGAFGVSSPPDEGGASLSLGAMWAFDAPFSFGPMLFADDLGARIGRLKDPNDGTDLGATEDAHRFAFGGAWRFDAGLPSLGSWEPFASAAYGIYRIQDDRLGVTQGALTTAGASIGAGIRRPLPGWGALGVSVRYHQLTNELVRHYVSAGVDWSWRPWQEAAGTAER